MRKAIFVDRDGTLNHDDYGYCHKVSELVVYQDAARLVKEFRRLGFLIVVISNQSGIGRGYYRESDTKRFNSELNRRLGNSVDAFYWCPHKPEDKCGCRKPGTGLIERAAKELDIDLGRSLVVGDRNDVDGEMARRLGMGCIIINRVPEYAVVLAGGLGMRLRPITRSIPKPLVEIAGKPVICHVIDNLVKNGVETVIVCTGYKGPMIKRYLDSHYRGKGVPNIIYSYHKRMINTGTRLRFAVKENNIGTDTAVLFGDDVNKINLKRMYRFHKQKGSDITIAVKSIKDVSGSGATKISKSKMTSFIEKPKGGGSGFVNCGIHIFSKGALEHLPDGDFNLTRDFFPEALRSDSLGLYAYKSKDLWLPLDTPERYNKAKRLLK